MREIKFRAWDGEKKVFYTTDLECIKNDSGYWFIGEYSIHPDFFMGWCEVIGKPLLLEQYTGLKNKNGVEIYEGDIVNYTYGHWDGLACKVRDMITITKKIYFDDGCFRYGDLNNESNSFLDDTPIDDISNEVIGNIHENQELLDG